MEKARLKIICRKERIDIKKKIVCCIGLICLLAVAVGGFYLSKKSDEKMLSEEQKVTDKVLVDTDKRIEQAVESEIPSIIVSEVEAKAGENVTVTAEIVNNPGILGMALTLSYDEHVLKLLDVKNGEAFDEILNMSHSEKLDNGCIFLWDGENITSDQIKDGNIITLEFQVLKDAKAAKSPIMLVYDQDEIVDNDLQSVKIAIENGAVLITD